MGSRIGIRNEIVTVHVLPGLALEQDRNKDKKDFQVVCWVYTLTATQLTLLWLDRLDVHFKFQTISKDDGMEPDKGYGSDSKGNPMPKHSSYDIDDVLSKLHAMTHLH